MENHSTKNGRGSNPLVYLFRKTWQYSAGNRKNIGWSWVMFVIAETISMIAHPLIFAKIINIVQVAIQKHGCITKAEIGSLWEFLLITLFVEVTFWSLHGPARVMERRNAFKVRANYRKSLLKGVMTLPMEWHVEHHSGNTNDKIKEGTGGLLNFSEESYGFIYGGVQLAVSYGMLAYFSPSSAYIVLAMILVTMWIIMRFDKVLIGHYQELNRAENRVSESIADAVANITTVITLRVERFVFEAISRKIDQPYNLFALNTRISEIKWFITNVCASFVTVLVLGFYFWHNIGVRHGILMGSLYLLINYLKEVCSLFFQFCWRYSEVLQNKAKVMNSEELSDSFRAENFTNHVLPANWRKLQIDGLNFSYRNGEGAQNLDDLSLSIGRGERIALVGESGGGKTTLLNVIRDNRHPQSITLSVDGKIIPQGFEGISQAITLIPQDSEIFTSTILWNITMGAEYDLDFVRQFTDMACLTKVIENLPRKFDSLIKEKGVNLSGGEQQRLALARGLLACHNKDIVLLDEPTSSIDGANEMQIHRNIFKVFAGKTIISSTHRLHLLPLFDRICFMSGGKIIASGSLNELLATCPEFQSLWLRYHERTPENAAP